MFDTTATAAVVRDAIWAQLGQSRTKPPSWRPGDRLIWSRNGITTLVNCKKLNPAYPETLVYRPGANVTTWVPDDQLAAIGRISRLAGMQ
jgi:hypothetical protein